MSSPSRCVLRRGAPEEDAAASSKPALPFGALAALPAEDRAAPVAPSLLLQHPLTETFALSAEDEAAVRAPLLPFLSSSLPQEPARAPALAIPGAPWSVERAPLAPAQTLALSVTPPEAASPTPVTNEPIGIEKLAAIAAELAERGVPRGEVLGAHGLSDARWAEAEKRWTEALAAEVKRGERALLEAHDDAFVKAWQAIRGPFEPADYARLTLAGERGDLAAALEAMAIRRTTWMRLKRVFNRRVAADPGLAARVKQALADQRRSGRAPADASRWGTPSNPRRR